MFKFKLFTHIQYYHNITYLTVKYAEDEHQGINEEICTLFMYKMYKLTDIQQILNNMSL